MKRRPGIRFWGVLVLILGVGAGPGFACTGEDPGGRSEEATRPEASTEAQAASADDGVTPARADTVDDGRPLARRLRDASVAARVKMALVDDKNLAPFDFEAVVNEGRVALRGTVRTAEQRAQAAAIARDVSGVREVRNEVTATEAPALAEERPEPERTEPERTEPERTEEPEQPEEPQRRPADEPTPKPAEPAAEEAPQPAASDEVYHTVQSGESLWTISRKYGTTTDRIKQLNSLRSDNLRPGQRLRVK